MGIARRLGAITIRDLFLIAWLIVAVGFYALALVGIPYYAVTEIGWPEGAEWFAWLLGVLPVWLAFLAPALIMLGRWRDGMGDLREWWAKGDPGNERQPTG